MGLLFDAMSAVQNLALTVLTLLSVLHDEFADGTHEILDDLALRCRSQFIVLDDNFAVFLVFHTFIKN